MKRITLLASAIAVITLYSCGGKNENTTALPEKTETVEETKPAVSKISSTVKPLATSVKGDLKGYIEVVSGEYEIKKDGDKWKASIKIKNIKTHKKTKFDQAPGQEITLKFYDENEKPVELKEGFRIYEQNSASIGSFITSEAGGEEWLELESYGDYEKSYQTGLPAEIKFFSLETRVY